MNYPLEDVSFLHFKSLQSTNQKLYQLSEKDIAAWTVVSCDEQFGGKGYGQNVWSSEPYQNAHFSFLLRHPFQIISELPFLNMWVSTQLVAYLSEWQIKAKVKWPNDIILNDKKLAGILIENKIISNQTKFSVIGLGININQQVFSHLPQATSIAKENPSMKVDVQEFIHDLMGFYHRKFYMLQQYMFDEIVADYNKHLFRRDQVSVFEWNGKKHNGIIKKVLPNGNIHIALENLGLKEFRFKEIKMLY